jgi:hypothetical protein
LGSLIYANAGIEIEFDDRLLTHVQLVMGAKLRRGESFFFTWRDDPSVGDGRSAIWVEPSIPMYFKYSGGRQPTINREWLELLTASANSGQGLQIVPEPGSRETKTQSNDNSVKRKD